MLIQGEPGAIRQDLSDINTAVEVGTCKERRILGDMSVSSGHESAADLLERIDALHWIGRKSLMISFRSPDAAYDEPDWLGSARDRKERRHTLSPLGHV